MKATISGVMIDYTGVTNSEVRTRLDATLTNPDHLEVYTEVIIDLPRNTNKITIVTDNSISSANSITVQGNILIKMSDSYSLSDKARVPTTLYHEISHQTKKVNLIGEFGLKDFKSKNKSAYDQLVQEVGKNKADQWIAYAYEEASIKNATNIFRKEVGIPGKDYIPSIWEAIAFRSNLQTIKDIEGRYGFLKGIEYEFLDREIQTGFWDGVGDLFSNLVHDIGESFKAPRQAGDGFDGYEKVTTAYISGSLTADRVYTSGKFEGQNYQPGGDYDKDGKLSGKDLAARNADLYEKFSKTAETAQEREYYAKRAEEYKKKADGVKTDKDIKTDKDKGDKSSKPVLLDLNGDGVKITEFDKSTIFMDGGDGLKHRTAWAGVGDGVLFYDVGNDNQITEKREFVFTEWNPTAAGDLEALRSVWDTNGDGKLTAADAEFAKFKVLVTNADGSTTVMTLAALGITEINLTANTVNIELPDGSTITGQTTFTRANGTTGTVANTTLTADAAGYRVVETVSTDAGGNRVVVKTGYAADGSVAFTVKSVTNPAGTLVTNSYDDNGDGVVDRLQTITKVTNGNGSKTETVINKAGADQPTALLVNRTVTTTSADGKVITIERDSLGGGWFDQREVWTTNADGSRTEVLSELAQNGTVIHSRSETVSINGLVRTEGTDLDGNGAAETVVGHTITLAGDNSRTELVTVRNGDNSLRASETETVSANGKVRNVASDLDGDGDVDRTDQMSITGAAGAATTSVATVKNGDGSTRSVTTVVQSADTLVKTTTADVDGDGDIDMTTIDATVIAVDGSRVRTVTTTNTDGSVRQMMKETLGADKVTAETWVDQNQDGVFQATDLVQSVTVTAGTLARTETTWARNPDGSVNAKSVAVTTADGLTTTTTVDADGDGDTDTSISDVTTIASGVATRVVQVTNQNAGLRSREVTTTSADGLTVTRTIDIDGNGTIDARTVDARVLGGDGSVTRTVSEYAGNGTTLTGRTVSVESADRRTVTITTDGNGDGATDRVVSSVEAADGSKTITETSFYASGAMAAKTVTTTSANGLVSSTTVDANGDLVNETVVANTTALNANGSRVQTVDVNNGDGSNRTLSVTTVSDDGLMVTAQSDMNGDNLFDRTSTSTKVLNANGSVTETNQSRAQSNALLSQTQSTVSDDGLVTVVQADADGDGDFDLVTTQTITLLGDGGRTVSTELRTDTSVLRNKTVTTSTDDGRLVTSTADVNGDGLTDSLLTRVVANNGTVTATTSQLSTTGALQSRTVSEASDDGLTASQKWDRNGDGTYERQTDQVTVLNANGSTTTTTTGKGANGATYVRSIVTTSDDGWVSTRTDDMDGDGTIELTTARTTAIAQDGVQTDTVQTTSENNGLTGRTVTVTSADRRTITQSTDLDGNGTNDRVTVTSVANSGQTTSTTTYLSTGGALEASFVRTVSGDGLVTTTAHDTNGDGRVDLGSVDRTVLLASGGSTSSMVYTNERNQTVARQEVTVSDDGNATSIAMDLNGDGVFEFRTDTSRSYAANGDVVVRQATKDGTDDTISEVQTTISGNGLKSTVTTDFSGDGNTDRAVTMTRLADGSWVEASTLYYPGTKVLETQQRSMSADGRTLTTTRDLNGDGKTDRSIVAVTDLSNNIQVEYKDARLDGTRSILITEKASANGMNRSFTFDVDNDNKSDFARFTDTRFNADGSSVETFREVYEANSAIYGTYGAKKEVYTEVTTRSANGLQSVTQIDADGNGAFDATTTDTTTIGVDGSRTTISETRYADNSLRSRFETKISADERLRVSTADYDGNGIADKISESRVLADGSTVVTEHSFGQGGVKNQTFVTTTSADGLVTRISRGATEQVITRSAIDANSYTWTNGVAATTATTSVVVSHQIDALGVETWTMTSKWYVSTTLQTSVSTVRLDAAAKERVLAEAARIFDTVLDRDMDVAEIEMLVPQIANGQLDEVALASQLLGSGEFTTRYGTQLNLTNAEFVTQIYLNALGRVPSLVELSENLTALANNSITRAKFAAGVSEGVEHVVVGNGHMATNNFDTIMNPAAFERSLDAAYVRTIVENLVDVVYDRSATAQELSYLTDLLLRGLSNPDDIASLLIGVRGDVQGTATSSLFSLTGAALVKQAFINALGRQPTATEQATWEAHLSANRISVAQFVASLAQSMDHLSVGPNSVATLVPVVTTLNGTSAANTLTGGVGQDLLNGLEGNDVLVGGDGSDRLIGGTGADVLWGGVANAAPVSNGSDTYVWSKNDGNDTINDWGQSRLETDTLQFTNVTSTEVTLTASGTDLLVTVVPTGEVIRIDERYQNAGLSYGIEQITFSDGVTWTLNDLLAKARLNGDVAANTLTGTAYRDNLYGLDGNDVLNGGEGDDVLVGGLGVDSLNGGNGGDTYIWQRGQGGDIITDVGTSLTEIDTLVLTDVLSSQITLNRISGFADIRFVVDAAGANPSELIRLVNQYQNIATGTGIEKVVFEDGVTWSLTDLLNNTRTSGGPANDTLQGTAYRDYVLGFLGNDTLNALGGDDRLDGGAGNDLLDGGAGSDLYDYALTQGNDTINDTGTSMVEVDELYLRNAASGDVTLARANGSADLLIKFTNGEVITVKNQFLTPTSGVGLERIRFNDGAIWSLADILSRTRSDGTAVVDTLTGTAQRDNLYGFAGNDTLNGNDGDDLLVGGLNVDSLAGGNGSDLYEWSKGDGNDTINDAGAAVVEVDTLVLRDVASTGAVLGKSGVNLLVTIPQTGEVITILNRFSAAAGGAGIEAIEFSDGVVTRILEGPLATVVTTGTAAAEALTGWAYADSLSGLVGNDTLTGNDGADTLVGGVGVDSLAGGNGADLYVWTKGDGNDNLNDAGASLTEVDRLSLTNVASTDVLLSRVNGSANLLVKVVSTGEVLTILNRMTATVAGTGIESISFSDGVTWTLEDMMAATKLDGTTIAETLTGTAYKDNMSGQAGNDVLNSGDGDDVLVGGTGIDALNGSNGSDSYEWSKGDGNDVINDAGASLTQVDTLILKNVVTADGIRMNRVNGTIDLTILIESTGETIKVVGQYANVAAGIGIERIVFADGLVWQLDSILDQSRVSGGSTNDSIAGTAFDDNMWGFIGNDTLTGSLGDDTLHGGVGVDQLDGGTGNDVFKWWHGDANDALSDTGTSIFETDILHLVGVYKSAVDLYRVSGSNSLRVDIVDANGVKETVIVSNQFLDPASGVGLEGIQFDDGTIWNREHILNYTSTSGTGNNNNNFVGSASRDRMFGRLGDDTLDGGAGNDLLVGGAGADVIYGGAGIDRISYYDDATQGVTVDLRLTSAQIGNPGGDEVGDRIQGIEDLDGTRFNDHLTGDDQSNYLAGGEGADTILGLDGFDQIRGGSGNDTIYGGDGADDIRGDHNSDVLYGGAGGDTIEGGSVHDTIFGGTGDDYIMAGSGNDILWGEQGRDTFHFVDQAFEYDVVMDFEDNVDKIWFAPSAADDIADFALSGNGTNSVTLTIGASTLVINGLVPMTLTADDFLFA